MDPKTILIADIAKVANDTIDELRDLWKVMYTLTPELEEKYCKSFLAAVQSICQDMIAMEIEKKNQMAERVQGLIAQQGRLQEELRESIPLTCDDSMPLREIIETLNSNLEVYRQRKIERVKKLAELRAIESKLCLILAVEAKAITSDVPSEEELHDLQNHIEALEITKIERAAQLQSVKTQLHQMMEQLEVTDHGDPFEKQVVEDAVDDFVLSVENMEKLEDLKAKYERLVAEATERISRLQQELERLWAQVETVDNGRTQFRADDRIGKTAELALTNEIERCKAVRKSMIRGVIAHLRDQIADMWDLMCYTEEQRSAFNAYRADLFNEDTLQLHELELNNLRDFYETNKTIFDLATRRVKYVQKLRDLDASAKDPKRLLNRGGQLLKDEKERKAANAGLHKTDDQLRELLADFMDRTGNVFVWNGQDLLALISGGVHERPVTVSQANPKSEENRSAVKRKREEAESTFIVQPLTTSTASNIQRPESEAQNGDWNQPGKKLILGTKIPRPK
ncbi:protein Hypothetical protein cytokinesis [Nesidiocoris tenuis]|uniref:Protein regulator of cytokinesis 1 n=1 Tax=Nesidiocoris tenuis TaxID=355587 RepID=A0ABN7AW15_9HEMI|nr:protein Hypothetical protein cytokinesis [Nesidiocoris tenuis]